jgi:outer membrane phospholipase A
MRNDLDNTSDPFRDQDFTPRLVLRQARSAASAAGCTIRSLTLVNFCHGKNDHRTQVIPNARLCKALLDRITDRAHILETGTESYRFRRTAEKHKKGAKAN